VWILGNKEADRLAGKGAIEVPLNQFTAVPVSVGKKKSIRPGGLTVLAANSPRC
jgi:hypothetical protein